MASLYSKFLDFIGIEETDEDEEERDDYYREDRDDYYRNERPNRERSFRGGRNDRDDRDDRDFRDDREENVVNFRHGSGSVPRQQPQRQQPQPRRSERQSAAPMSNGGSLPIQGGMKMIVYHPVSYEDTQIIIDNLKNRKPVIVNMEELDVDCAQRILDFLSGAVYALSGTMCKISRGIFVVAPTNYDVVGNNDEFGDSL